MSVHILTNDFFCAMINFCFIIFSRISFQFFKQKDTAKVAMFSLFSMRVVCMRVPKSCSARLRARRSTLLPAMVSHFSLGHLAIIKNFLDCKL